MHLFSFSYDTVASLQEDQEYWENVADKLQSPHASINRFLQEMDLSYPFGVTPDMISSKAKPKLYEDFLEYKLKHPRRVILVRVRPVVSHTTTNSLLLSAHIV